MSDHDNSTFCGTNASAGGRDGFLFDPRVYEVKEDKAEETAPEPEALGITILGSGSAGNAIVIHTPSSALLVDAGFSARQLRQRMREAQFDEGLLRAALVSHEHSDHVRGLRVVAKQLDLPVYTNRLTGNILKSRDNVGAPLHVFTSGSAFQIDGFEVEAFSIPHDASDPVGFIVRHGPYKIGIATDLGHASHLVCHQLRECDVLVLESNHDLELLRSSQRPWSLKQRIMGRHGHLSNQASMELVKHVLHARTRHLVLAHASRDCNRYELIEDQAAACLSELERDDIVAHVARQDTVLPTLWL